MANDDLSRGYYFFLMGRVFSENYMGLSDGRGEVVKTFLTKTPTYAVSATSSNLAEKRVPDILPHQVFHPPQ